MLEITNKNPMRNHHFPMDAPWFFSPGLAACPDVHDALGSARRCRRGVRLNAAWGNHGFFMREIIPFYGFVWKWCIAPI